MERAISSGLLAANEILHCEGLQSADHYFQCESRGVLKADSNDPKPHPSFWD